jgi:hypothetical protein
MTLKQFIKVTALAVLTATQLLAAKGAQINGGISFSGPVLALDSSSNVTYDFSQAASFVFGPDMGQLPPTVSAPAPTGDFGTVAVGSVVSVASPLQINPAVLPAGPLFSVGGFSLTATTLVESSFDSTTVTLKGSGVFAGPGFDPTPGIFIATFNTLGGTASFSFSSVATPTPGGCTGQIGDYVWNDLNANGCQDANEPGIAGVTVDLYSGCGPGSTLIATTNTDANGKYLFTGLCAGTYSVGFHTPSGYIHTLANQACTVGGVLSTETTSKCECTGTADCTVCVTLATDNSSNLTIDCGYLSCNCIVAITCPQSLNLCSGDPIPDATQAASQMVANDSCRGIVPVSFLRAVTNGTCPTIITRTFGAYDRCGKLYTCNQTITINCKPNCTVTAPTTATTGTAGYTASVANAGAGANYSWSVSNGTITGGQGTSGITWTAGTDTNHPIVICVTITLQTGCSSTCCANVTLKSGPNGFCTWTPGGWGAPPNGNNVATFLYQIFPSAYPKGVTVGGGYTIKLTTPQAVTIFLPSGGTPSSLKKSYINPTTTEAGEFASQVLALQFNVDASLKGYTKAGLANLKIASGNPLAGYTVAQVLAMANQALGGNTSALPPGVTIPTLTTLFSSINGSFDNCTNTNKVLGF